MAHSNLADHKIVSTSRYFILGCLAGLTSIIISGLMTPLSANAVTSMSQSYSTNSKIAQGSIVSSVDNDPDRVVASLVSSADQIFGVVINTDSSAISISNGDDNQAQVATSGTLQVLVSDINGQIYRGDHITASPIAGVGMKATSNVRIVGIAQDDLTSGSKQSYTDKDGKKQTTLIGEISVLVNVSYYFKEPDKTLVPAVIQNLANTLAGKTVNTLPIIISAVIFIITIIVVISIIFTMIRSSIISVGRNPMSQSAIYRDLIQLSALVLAILGVGTVAIYLVLTKM